MQRCGILVITCVVLLSSSSCVEHTPEQSLPAAPTRAPAKLDGITSNHAVSDSGAETSPVRDLPVTMTARVAHSEVQAERAIQLAIELNIGRGWRVHASNSSGPFVPLSVKLEDAQGTSLVGDINFPESKLRLASGVEEHVYEDEALIEVNFGENNPRIAEGQTIRCTVEYQACNQFRCLPPEMRMIEIELRDGAVAEGLEVSQEN